MMNVLIDDVHVFIYQSNICVCLGMCDIHVIIGYCTNIFVWCKIFIYADVAYPKRILKNEIWVWFSSSAFCCPSGHNSSIWWIISLRYNFFIWLNIPSGHNSSFLWIYKFKFRNVRPSGHNFQILWRIIQYINWNWKKQNLKCKPNKYLWKKK